MSLQRLCRSCTGFDDEVRCQSLDCPVLYKRTNAAFDAEQIAHVQDIMKELKI